MKGSNNVWGQMLNQNKSHVCYTIILQNTNKAPKQYKYRYDLVFVSTTLKNNAWNAFLKLRNVLKLIK